MIFARLALLLLLAGAASVHAREDPRFERARVAFERGLRLLDASDHARAAQAFRESLEHRKALPAYYNLALAYQGMGKVKLALATLSDHILLARAQNAKEEALQAERLIEQLTQQLAQVTLVLAGPVDQLSIDGEPHPLDSATQVAALDPGEHIFEAKREGYEPVRHILKLKSGARQRVELDASQKPLFGELVVEANNPEAEIRVDGQVVGRGAHRAKVSPGPREVEVSLPGAEPWRQTLTVIAGAEARAYVILGEPDPPITDRWWFWAAIGAVAVAAAAGVAVAARGEEEPRGGSLGLVIGALEP